MTGFLDKLIDWKEFELFVRDLYIDSDEVLVEHNVTKTGKSNATRQIDVYVTHKSKLHSYTTLIECKSWKHRVDRARIDVMAASIDDLNASKGVIFTTKGYQEGAIEYAKFKNIDIFVVRDLTDAEWGKPGKHIEFFIQYINTNIEDIKVANASLLPIVDEFPNDLKVRIIIKKDFIDENLFLYSKKDGQRNKNIVEILLSIKNDIANSIGSQLGVLTSDAGDVKPQLGFKTDVLLDFENSEFKQFRYPFGVVNLGIIQFSVMTSVDQDKFEFDRATNLDFALIVENYITKQKNFVIKRKAFSKLDVSEQIKDKTEQAGEALENGSILKIYFDPYVSFEMKPETTVNKTNDLILKLNK